MLMICNSLTCAPGNASNGPGHGVGFPRLRRLQLQHNKSSPAVILIIIRSSLIIMIIIIIAMEGCNFSKEGPLLLSRFHFSDVIFNFLCPTLGSNSDDCFKQFCLFVRIECVISCLKHFYQICFFKTKYQNMKMLFATC